MTVSGSDRTIGCQRMAELQKPSASLGTGGDWGTHGPHSFGMGTTVPGRGTQPGTITLPLACRGSSQIAATPWERHTKQVFWGRVPVTRGGEGRQSPRVLHDILGRPQKGEIGGNHWQHSPAPKLAWCRRAGCTQWLLLTESQFLHHSFIASLVSIFACLQVNALGLTWGTEAHTQSLQSLWAYTGTDGFNDDHWQGFFF